MTQSSGYFLVGSKSAGLINTPSIVVPSVLFQEITSRVPNTSGFVCSVMLVRARGEKFFAAERYTSLSEVGDVAVKDSCPPSRVKENEPAIKLSGPDMRVTFPLAGSTRNSCDDVFCCAVK